MAEFKTINTQEEFDNAIKDRLNRAENKIREEYKGWTSPDDLKKITEKHGEELKALNTQHSKDMEKYAGYDEKFKDFESKIHGYEVSALKIKVALDKKLPPESVEFLQGEDEQSITESAERLAGLTAPHSVGFTRNTEKATDDKNSMWLELSQKLAKR